MPFPEPALPRTFRRTLLGVARQSIERGVREARPFAVEARSYPPELRAPRATFVTLRCAKELRGCVGALEAKVPLVESVALNAYRSAFEDPRFPAVREAEVAGLEIHISLLSPLERLDVGSEKALLAALRPRVDGLVVQEGSQRATFLPAVWESLPEPDAFVRELERKAGLPPEWSTEAEWWRYTVEEIASDVGV
jgi:AmmeMemoRadiSam system protein A